MRTAAMRAFPRSGAVPSLFAAALVAAWLAAASPAAGQPGSPAAVNSPPVFTSSPPAAATVGSVYRYTVIVSDPDGDAVTISALRKPSWLLLSRRADGTARLRGTPPAAAVGRHVVRLLAADAHGATALQRFVITVAPAPAAPGVETWAAAMVGTSGGSIRGAVNPHGLPTQAWFEWGTDRDLATFEQSAPVDVGSGTASSPVSLRLGGLSTGVTTYYRVVAQNELGRTAGPADYFAPLPSDPASIVVNCPDDPALWLPGKMTIRAAIEQVAPGGTITFDPALDGGRIGLTIVGEPNATLQGEVFSMGATGWVFDGYFERNYGRSALYARKSLVIDASALPRGVTLAWAGGDANRARVLAVYGNLLLRNVTVTGGRAESEPIPGGVQPATLGRGGGVAVWGVASLERCTISGNAAVGDLAPSRDRGAFGGGIYADWLIVKDSVISGNSVTGYGAAGGGLYSVGGAEWWTTPEWPEPEWDGKGSAVLRSSVTGNRVTGQHAYGGGVYSDGGGPGNLMTLRVEDATIARNLVEDHPALAQSAMTQYYYRGGGIYMSNGYLTLRASTVAENAVTGVPAVFGGKPNLAGGGIAATIGNAHVVEAMTVWHSLVVGNTANGAASDLFTGSLLDFYSDGYNLVGAIDFSQILVPVPAWMCLSRRHWPKVGDAEGVDAAAVLDLAGARYSGAITSVGTDAGRPALLWYPPLGEAVGRIPGDDYEVQHIWAEYLLAFDGATDDFLPLIIDKLRYEYPPDLGPGFGPDFGTSLGDVSAIDWTGEPYTWPSLPENADWIGFWHDLDAEIGDRLGAVRLGDDFWGTFASGPFGENILMSVYPFTNGAIVRSSVDQNGTDRFGDLRGDAGAIESPGP